MEERTIYEDIALRTEGDIYIGVVGPVRTGKSTFIKRFMETMVIPNIENVYRRERARDELPQSGSGRTVMTAEPKFVPEDAVEVTLENGAAFSVRLIDCVGYMVPGAAGQMEDDMPRMVSTPWFDHDIPMTEAAEIGTRKVVTEHSTIAIVVTTDGTITDIPREDYLEAEERVITELKELGKPFLVVLNSAYPGAERAQAIRADLASRYDVTCVAANCLELEENAVADIIRGVLYEFPVKELDLYLPPWVDALAYDHPIKSELYTAIREGAGGMRRIRDVEGAVAAIGACESVSSARITNINLGTGLAAATLGGFFLAWDWPHMMGASVSSQWNYWVESMVARPFLTWADFTVGQYLAACSALGAALVAACGLMAAACGMLARNGYAAALALALLCTGALAARMAFASAEWWPAYYAAMLLPTNVWLSAPAWFTEGGLSAIVPWQESVGAGFGVALFGLACVLAARRFGRKDIVSWNS